MSNFPVIKTDLNSLWNAYSGRARSGRFECPITIVDCGREIEATHIYRGYGTTRLENIPGKPSSKKGFQGTDVTPRLTTFLIQD